MTFPEWNQMWRPPASVRPMNGDEYGASRLAASEMNQSDHANAKPLAETMQIHGTLRTRVYFSRHRWAQNCQWSRYCSLQVL
jgi:hypothetical protein